MMQVVAEVSRAFVSDNSFTSDHVVSVYSNFPCATKWWHFWQEFNTHLSLLQVLAGVANASVNDKSFGGNLARVCPLWRCNVAHMLYVSFPGSRVWLRQCSSPRVDWFDLWIQTAGSCRCWSQQCVLLLLLREQCWYPLHWLHIRLSFNLLTCSCVSWNWCLNRFYWFYALFCP